MLNYEYPPIGGGGGVVCRDLCEQAVRDGHNIEVVTMWYYGLTVLEEHGNLVIHRVKCIRTQMRVCYPWEQLLYCITAYRYIMKNIAMDRIDLIHCHFIVPTGLLMLWLKKKYKTKCIITAHGSDVLGHNNMRFKYLYKFIKPVWMKILGSADAVTAPSQYLLKKIKSSYPGLGCICIPNGINIKEYTALEKKKSIITLSRLQESKGIQDLIKVLPSVEIGEWEVNILGEGPYKLELERLVEEKGLCDKVHFQGHVTGEKRIQYLEEAGIFFSGSRFEAFSLSVLEASIAKCMIIATDIEPHAFLVGKEHLYNNEKELREILSKAIHNRPQCIEYGNEKYDWSVIYERYNTLYKSLLGRDADIV